MQDWEKMGKQFMQGERGKQLEALAASPEGKRLEQQLNPAAVEKARAFIGADLFDYLLDPPVVYGERDKSQDNAFGA